MMAKFTRRPDEVANPPDANSAVMEAYLDAAEQRSGMLPWETATVRAEMKIPFTLRLPEPLHLQLKWLSAKDKDSMHEICLQAIINEVNARLKRYGL
jgi:hypothetical protein